MVLSAVRLGVLHNQHSWSPAKYFSYFSTKTYVTGILSEASGQGSLMASKLCFGREIKKYKPFWLKKVPYLVIWLRQ